jgi:trans-aconitate methyltransferase
MMDDEADVPYGEDFHDPAAAAAWADAAMRKRPWRATIFEHFVSIVGRSPVTRPRVLELGSGPGLLAEQILARCPAVGPYTLVDFSQAMLEQSRLRLEAHAARTRFLRADFKTEDWPELVQGPFDLVLSLQAVHELRHKRHAPRLYRQLLPLLSPAAEVLICDHLPDGAHTPRHRVLYMNRDENVAAFEQAGFSSVEIVWSDHDMAFYRARRHG